MNKYWLDKPNNYGCLYEQTVESGTINRLITNQIQSNAYSYQSSLTLSSGTDEFLVYSSPYSGAFALLNSMYVPKPCAYVSVNMT